MKLVCLDSTGVVKDGPGSPAYFSRFVITHLKSLGHEVIISPRFDDRLCANADAVWTEWGNEEAYEAAASGVCRRLVVRMRGFDAHGPLDRLEWPNVDALVYESPFLKSYVEGRFPGLRGFRSHVIPSGVDVANIPFRERSHGPVVAMVGRADAAKGLQLALEWARQRPIKLHIALALGEANPRLIEYLRHVRPANVSIVPTVNTVKWLDEIKANYLLSASIWETLGYTIAEALATGVKPLVHDTPGAALNWPSNLVRRWTALSDLDELTNRIDSSYDSCAYRTFVEENLDAVQQSVKFTEILLAPSTRQVVPPAPGLLIGQIQAALRAGQLDAADQLLLEFRDRTPRLRGLDDHRAGLALGLAGAYFAANDLDRARVWALRSLDTTVRPDALCLLGEIAAAEGDVENAERWYCAALDLGEVPTRYPVRGLERMSARWRELDKEVRPSATPPTGFHAVKRFLIVVAVRNAEKYIGACLESIKAQRGFHCIVIDDASTDGTTAVVIDAVAPDTFTILQRKERRYSLRNIVEAIQTYGQPNDVVVIVDGDDQLDPMALYTIQGEYQRGAWMTYGNFTTTSGSKSWMPPYPKRVVEANAFREWPWSVSHPKTFRKELFDHIKLEDFQHDGQWFQTAGDVALMMPMLEMAAERAVYISQPIYTWNDQNAESDHRVDPDGQVRVRNLILAKPKYDRLEKL